MKKNKQKILFKNNDILRDFLILISLLIFFQSYQGVLADPSETETHAVGDHVKSQAQTFKNTLFKTTLFKAGNLPDVSMHVMELFLNELIKMGLPVSQLTPELIPQSNKQSQKLISDGSSNKIKITKQILNTVAESVLKEIRTDSLELEEREKFEKEVKIIVSEGQRNVYWKAYLKVRSELMPQIESMFRFIFQNGLNPAEVVKSPVIKEAIYQQISNEGKTSNIYAKRYRVKTPEKSSQSQTGKELTDITRQSNPEYIDVDTGIQLTSNDEAIRFGPRYMFNEFKSATIQTAKQLPLEVGYFYAGVVALAGVIQAFDSASNPNGFSSSFGMFLDPKTIINFESVFHFGTFMVGSRFTNSVLTLGMRRFGLSKHYRQLAHLFGFAGMAGGMLLSNFIQDQYQTAKSCSLGYMMDRSNMSGQELKQHQSTCDEAYKRWIEGRMAFKYFGEAIHLLAAAGASMAVPLTINGLKNIFTTKATAEGAIDASLKMLPLNRKSILTSMKLTFLKASGSVGQFILKAPQFVIKTGNIFTFLGMSYLLEDGITKRFESYDLAGDLNNITDKLTKSLRSFFYNNREIKFQKSADSCGNLIQKLTGHQKEAELYNAKENKCYEDTVIEDLFEYSKAQGEWRQFILAKTKSVFEAWKSHTEKLVLSHDIGAVFYQSLLERIYYKGSDLYGEDNIYTGLRGIRNTSIDEVFEKKPYYIEDNGVVSISNMIEYQKLNLHLANTRIDSWIKNYPKAFDEKLKRIKLEIENITSGKSFRKLSIGADKSKELLVSINGYVSSVDKNSPLGSQAEFSFSREEASHFREKQVKSLEQLDSNKIKELRFEKELLVKLNEFLDSVKKLNFETTSLLMTNPKQAQEYINYTERWMNQALKLSQDIFLSDNYVKHLVSEINFIVLGKMQFYMLHDINAHLRSFDLKKMRIGFSKIQDYGLHYGDYCDGVKKSYGVSNIDLNSTQLPFVCTFSELAEQLFGEQRVYARRLNGRDDYFTFQSYAHAMALEGKDIFPERLGDVITASSSKYILAQMVCGFDTKRKNSSWAKWLPTIQSDTSDWGWHLKLGKDERSVIHDPFGFEMKFLFPRLIPVDGDEYKICMDQTDHRMDEMYVNESIDSLGTKVEYFGKTYPNFIDLISENLIDELKPKEDPFESVEQFKNWWNVNVEEHYLKALERTRENYKNAIVKFLLPAIYGERKYLENPDSIVPTDYSQYGGEVIDQGIDQVESNLDGMNAHMYPPVILPYEKIRPLKANRNKAVPVLTSLFHEFDYYYDYVLGPSFLNTVSFLKSDNEFIIKRLKHYVEGSKNRVKKLMEYTMTYIPMENNEISVKHNGAAAQLLSIELLIFKSLLMGGDASEIKNVLSQVASFTKFVEGEENDRINQPEVSEKILKAFSDFEPNMQQEVIKVTEELFKEGMFISRFINQDYNGITDDQKMIINHVISAMLKAITEVVQYVGFITEFDSTLGYEEESVVTPEEVTEAAKKVGNVTFVNPFLASMIQEMDKQREEAKAAKEGRTK